MIARLTIKNETGDMFDSNYPDKNDHILIEFIEKNKEQILQLIAEFIVINNIHKP